MKHLLLCLSLLLGSVSAGAAQDSADESAMRDVISSQIDAFRADDFERAFTFASPMIRGIFGTPERFGMMVREGYPMVHRPADMAFLKSEDLGAVTNQKVMVRDQAGLFHVLEYEMIRVDGAWQINGVRLLDAPQVGA